MIITHCGKLKNLKYIHRGKDIIIELHLNYNRFTYRMFFSSKSSGLWEPNKQLIRILNLYYIDHLLSFVPCFAGMAICFVLKSDDDFSAVY